MCKLRWAWLHRPPPTPVWRGSSCMFNIVEAQKTLRNCRSVSSDGSSSNIRSRFHMCLFLHPKWTQSDSCFWDGWPLPTLAGTSIGFASLGRRPRLQVPIAYWALIAAIETSSLLEFLGAGWYNTDWMANPLQIARGRRQHLEPIQFCCLQLVSNWFLFF